MAIAQLFGSKKKGASQPPDQKAAWFVAACVRDNNAKIGGKQKLGEGDRQRESAAPTGTNKDRSKLLALEKKSAPPTALCH